MKKTIFLIFLWLAAITTFSQTEKKIIGVNKQYNKPDTTRTFCFLKPLNFDSSTDSLIKYFGSPKKKETEKIIWSDIEISGIGNKLNVELHDGIYSMIKGDMLSELFKSKEDKEKKLRELKSN